MGFAADLNLKASFGFRPSAAFTVLKPIGYGNVITTISHSPLISSTPLLAWSHKSSGRPLTEHTNPNVETNRRC
jgi:hypothetical protein